MTPDNRIWELDAARGLCILGMIAVHFIFDLTELYPVLHWQYPPFFLFLKNWGGVAFFLISGICVTLGSRYLRRGVIVLGCGLLVSAATDFIGAMPIRFGVLHCLGLCMLCWGLFKGASVKGLCICGIGFASLGLVFSEFTVYSPYLYWLGLTAPAFESADYFPLLPYLGYFLLGACLGKTLYRSRCSLFAGSFAFRPLIRFLRLCGKQSLLLYLIHQPVLIFLIEAALG